MLKPSSDSYYKQSYINPINCKKLFESQRDKPIICRSSWEKKFILWCENNKNVKRWGSECIQIPYISPLDNQRHIYYPDFLLEMENGERWIVEIKPYLQTQKPNKPTRWSMEQYIKNSAKWRAVQDVCKNKDNIKFIIITERILTKMI